MKWSYFHFSTQDAWRSISGRWGIFKYSHQVIKSLLACPQPYTHAGILKQFGEYRAPICHTKAGNLALHSEELRDNFEQMTLFYRSTGVVKICRVPGLSAGIEHVMLGSACQLGIYGIAGPPQSCRGGPAILYDIQSSSLRRQNNPTVSSLLLKRFIESTTRSKHNNRQR